VSWNGYPLSVLQICGIALGGQKLAALCRIFCGDFKQFHSGAPDLHMIRASLTCRTCQRKLNQQESEHYQTLDWKLTLGEGWNSNFNSNEDPDTSLDTIRGIFQEFSEDAILQHDNSGKQSQKKFFRNHTGKLVVRSLTIEEHLRRSQEKQTARRQQQRQVEETESQVIELEDNDDDDDGVEGMSGQILEQDDSLLSAAADHDASLELDPVKTPTTNTTPVPRFDPFLCFDEDICIPSPCLCSPSQERGLPHHGHDLVWAFETSFIEVKGPTDRLSETQQRWIHILNSNEMESVVCQVKEGKVMGITGGYHRTVTEESESDENS
jgi:hypothetical protein